MADKITSADQVDIYKISIGSERFQDGKELFIAGSKNHTPIVAELNIYENIFMPYLTGTIVMIDDNNIVKDLGIKGTERLYVVFKSPKTDTQIEKTFVISSIRRQIKTNEQRSLLILELIEQHGYFNELELINKSYTGNSVEIAQKILEDNSTMKIEDRSNYKIPEMLNGHMRYIVPWQTPYAAIQSVLNFSYTDNAMPYFFYSSLTSDNLILRDLESIIESEPFNEGLQPFTYSQSNSNSFNTNFINLIFTINELRAGEINDTLDLAKGGGVTTSFETFDTRTGSVGNIKTIRMYDELKNLVNDGVIKNTDEQHLFIDDNFRDTYRYNNSGTKNKSINDYNSARISYLSNKPYDDTAGLLSSTLAVKKAIVKNNYLQHLANNCIEISVPGYAFAVKSLNRSVGHQININILSDGSLIDTNGFIDDKRSGSYIMLTKKHVFNVKALTHNVVIKAGRVTEPIQPRGA